jgi:hypothetical protein
MKKKHANTSHRKTKKENFHQIQKYKDLCPSGEKQTKQYKKETFKEENQIKKRFFSCFINKIIYQLNFHVVENVNFEQQEKPIYEHIDKHQVLELYQAN